MRERSQGAAHPMLAPTLLNLSTLSEQRGDARRGARPSPSAPPAVLVGGAVTDDHPHLVASRERLAELAPGAA